MGVSWGTAEVPDLRGTIAVVTGTSRNVGRGIAVVLGECGAYVDELGSTLSRTAAKSRAKRYALWIGS